MVFDKKVFPELGTEKFIAKELVRLPSRIYFETNNLLKYKKNHTANIQGYLKKRMRHFFWEKAMVLRCFGHNKFVKRKLWQFRDEKHEFPKCWRMPTY